MRRSEAERNGFGLLSAVSGLERLRWAALGCDRSAPQLLHEMLPQLKTSMDTLSADDLWIACREREDFILNGNGRLGRERGWVTCTR
jgi:hypothetical protein